MVMPRASALPDTRSKVPMKFPALSYLYTCRSDRSTTRNRGEFPVPGSRAMPLRSPFEEVGLPAIPGE